jgi:superfamily II DNA or RNA helicase
MGSSGHLVDILHDFYIPVLKRSTRYDRVAGYFRSSSLAAASQGFSAFVAADGKMRLLVGADLDEADVEAILKGDRQRLAEGLNRELEFDTPWPEAVQNGVGLLAWMVARGVLEVRVALRVHSQSGRPLPFDDTCDGYVHEKWALFTDAAGNRLYASGSLNESRTALVHNAENIDVHADWWGDIERRRADEAQKTFKTVWCDQHPCLRVFTLPEALEKRLIQMGQRITRPLEIDGSSAIRPEVAPPSALEKLQFAVIKDGPRLPGGRFVGMYTAPVAPWPHQEVAARRLVETWPYSFLLCDEVGLGKTIEAGLAIRSLLLCGLAKRVLIAPPAALTRQWQREMASKFFLPFSRALTGALPRHEVIYPIEETVAADNIFAPDLNIVSTGLVSRPDRQNELQAAVHFDIALVDEAHYARRKNPKNGARTHPQFGNLYRAMDSTLRKKTASLWMATATPMQLDWIEVFDLLSLTDRVGAFQFDPSLTWAYYQALGALVRDTDIEAAQWDFMRQGICALERQDPFLWTYLRESVIDGRIRTAARIWLEQGIAPHGTDRRNIQRLIFAASPLSRVMLRHNRPLLEIYKENGQLNANLARREILPIPRIVLEGLEKRAYEDLEAYCRDLTVKIAEHATGRNWRTSLGFYLSFLRLRLASSMFAIRETLRRRKERVAATLAYQGGTDYPSAEAEDLELYIEEGEEPDEGVLDQLLKGRTPEDLAWEQERLEQILEGLEDLSEMPLKMRELLRVLNQRQLPGGRIRQTVIFTRFADTLQDLVERLRQVDISMLIGTYSGKGGQYTDPRTRKLRGTERDEIKHRFLRGEIDVLICTDAAAEGLNLQTADLLINYDLPWNPMKVEQRIGRIDRIGQKYDQVCVLNLCYADSAEQIVYERLLNRLVEAGYVVGAQQVSMLPVTREEFNELAAGSLSSERLEQIARDRLATQRRRSQSMEIPAGDLYEIYMRLKERYEAQRLPVALPDIWEAMVGSRYLRDLGCTVTTEPHLKLTIRGLDNVLDGTPLTVDRRLYEEGLADSARRLHFASYGDGVFEEVLRVFDAYELPGCVKRITEEVQGTHTQAVAFAAACIGSDGSRAVHLITSWADLDGLILDEETVLDESAVVDAKRRLHELVRREFDPTRAVDRLQRDNRRAAHAQRLLDLLVINQLIPPFDVSVTENFWSTVSGLDNLIQQREVLLVPKLPVPALQRVRGKTLFDVPTPQVGEVTSPTVPILLISAGLDAVCRIADAMRVRRSNLTIDSVKRRLQREIDLGQIG